MKPLYLGVTKDAYELPLAVADSAWELAALRGVDVTSILHAVSTKSGRQVKRSKYRAVWV